MKLVPTRPVTIIADRNAQRWFPFLFRHTDGSLLLYVENGFDANFSPFYRSRSVDGGKTWLAEEPNAPRVVWTHSFADGELLELDAYGVADPAQPDTYCYLAAWSNPGQPAAPVTQGIARVHAPSLGAATLTSMGGHGYPTFPWWPLFNSLHGKEDVTGDEVRIGGAYFMNGLEVAGRLLAVGYNNSRDDDTVSLVVCLESTDRGRNWHEVGVVARGKIGSAETPEGFNETSFAQLKDGRLHCVMRSGKRLYQVWSSDGGRSWTEPQPLRLIDSEHQPQMVWPTTKVLEDGTLVLTYGRPGKHMVFDPTGTGEQWQGHLDLHQWELDTQAMMGVPEELRLHGPTEQCIRYWDSGDYLGLVATGPRELLVTYDVQTYYESWNSVPVSGVRMVRVTLES
jgi:hypothetical protein